MAYHVFFQGERIWDECRGKGCLQDWMNAHPNEAEICEYLKGKLQWVTCLKCINFVIKSCVFHILMTDPVTTFSESMVLFSRKRL